MSQSDNISAAPLLPSEMASQTSITVPWYRRMRLKVPLWFRCCRLRSSRPEPKDRVAGVLGDRSSKPPPHSQVLPEFVIRMSSQYLQSVEIARLWCVDRCAESSLSLPGLVREISVLRGIEHDRLTTLAQLHLEEELPFGTNVVTFAFMSTDFSASSQSTLNRIGKLLKRHQAAMVSIEAHAQPGAPPDIAQHISHSRATSVADYLHRQGVTRSRLRVAAFATSRQLQGASNEQEHRRAEVFLTLEGVQFPSERLPATVARGAAARFGAWAMMRSNRDSSSDIASDSDSENSGLDVID